MSNKALTSLLQMLAVSCNIRNNSRKRDFLWHIGVEVKKMGKKKLSFVLNRHPFKTTGLTIEAQFLGDHRHQFLVTPRQTHLRSSNSTPFHSQQHNLSPSLCRVSITLCCRIYNRRKYIILRVKSSLFR